MVVLRVVSFTVNEVSVRDSEHFSGDNIRMSLPELEPGKPVNVSRLTRALQLANHHPAKQVAVTFAESKGADALDARLRVNDVSPFRLYADLNNTGEGRTGNNRLSVGFQHSNLWGRDQVATVSYTTSPGYFDQVNQFGVHYRIPLYRWFSSVSLYYSRSDIDSGRIGSFFEVSGSGSFLGIQYSYLLPAGRGIRQELSLGLEDRWFDNDISFANTPIGVDIRSRPVTVRYEGNWRRGAASLDFHAAYVFNLSWGEDNDRAAYAATRAGADEKWTALRYGAGLSLNMPGDWLFKTEFEGQYADEPLISGEQFGLGGAESVRGFAGRELDGDKGWRGTLEAWLPPLWQDVRALGFLDTGSLALNNPQPGDLDDESLTSIGVGVRWQWRDRLNVSLDAARTVDGWEETPAGEHKLHFSIFGSY